MSGVSVPFYDGSNKLPKCNLLYCFKHNSKTERGQKGIDSGSILIELREMPQISYTTKWDDAGGGRLLDFMSKFANSDYMKIAMGDNFKPFSPAGQWTAKIATEADWMRLELKTRVWHNTPQAATFMTKLYASVMPHNASTLEKSLENFTGLLKGEGNLSQRMSSATSEGKGMAEDAKNTAENLFKAGKILFKDENKTEDSKRELENALNSAKDKFTSIGTHLDNIVNLAGNPCGNYVWFINLLPLGFLNNVEFIIESFNITPSIQMVWASSEHERSLYYDVTIQFCSRSKVTAKTLGKS